MREQWLMHAKMIVVLSDDDINQMLLTPLAGGETASVLGDKIQAFRLSF